MPLPQIGEVCHLRFAMESATVEQISRAEQNRMQYKGRYKEENILFGKKVAVTKLSVEVSRVSDTFEDSSKTHRHRHMSHNHARDSASTPSSTNGKKNTTRRSSLLSVMKQFYISLAAPQLANIILTPMDLRCNMGVWKVPSPTLGDAVVSDYNIHLEADIRLSNVHITPHISQLLLLKQMVTRIEQDALRIKYLHLRPMQGPSIANRNIREWWIYAAGAVLMKRNGYVSHPVFKHNTEIEACWSGDVHTRTYYRNRYIYLYRMYIECKLRDFAASMNGKSNHKKATQAAVISDNGLSPKDQEELHYLHRIIPYEKLLIYRAIVHQGLQKAGVTLENIKKSLTMGNGLSRGGESSLWSFFTGETADIEVQTEVTGRMVWCMRCGKGLQLLWCESGVVNTRRSLYYLARWC